MPRLGLSRRKSSGPHYHSFPTSPPESQGKPPDSPRHAHATPSFSARRHDDDDGSLYDVSDGGGDGSGNSSGAKHTPMPRSQLAVLAAISLAEQTALNSISPYLPEMAASFPEVDPERVGLFVGIIASAFAAAQFATNVWWGCLSDRIGRKPVIMAGTVGTAACFVAFGFCHTLWQAVLVQAAMGAVNGNAGVVSTVLGEITDRSNQASTFSWLPIVYGIGGITGPIIGGTLVNTTLFASHPYLLPNLICALVLLLDLVMSAFLLDESLAYMQDLPPFGERLKCVFSWLWQFTTSHRPSYLRFSSDDDPGMGSLSPTLEDDSHSDMPALFPEQHNEDTLPYRAILVPQIVVLLVTYTIFNLSNIGYNSLYPIWASEARALVPSEIGLSLAFAGASTIVFQAFCFTPVQKYLGSRWLYRLSFLAFAGVFLCMPLVAHTPRGWLWTQLAVLLLIKTVAGVGGLTCAMLLITNAAPKPGVLGTLNGLAQTLSAGGRAVAPLVSGALFSGGERLGANEGEWLSWGTLAVTAAVGGALAFWLRGRRLEGDEDAPLLSGEGLAGVIEGHEEGEA